MGLVAVVLVAAVAVGRAAGGSLAALGRLPVPSAWLVPVAVAAQALGTAAALAGLPAGPAHALGLASSALVLTVFLARARRVVGLGLVALGLGLNALVVAANGAMPVSAAAAARAGAEDAALDGGLRHTTLDAGTRLPLLADVVPVPLPLRPEVVSAGDVLVAAGLGRLVVVGMRADRGTRRPPVSGSGVRRPIRPREGSWRSAGTSAGRARRARRTTASVPTPDTAAVRAPATGP